MADDTASVASEALYLGCGYKTFTERTANQVLKFTKKESDSEQKVNTDFCESKSAVFEALGIDAKLSVGIGGIGLSDRVQFAHSLFKFEFSAVVLVSAYHRTKEYAPDFSFSADFSRADELYRVAGDSYVSEIVQGSHYIAAYTFTCSSKTEQTDILNRTSLAIGGKVTADFNLGAAITKVEEETNIRATFAQRAFGSNLTLPGPSGIASFAVTFAKEKPSGPIAHEFEIRSYDTIRGCPDFRQIRDHQDKWNTAYRVPWAKAHEALRATEIITDLYSFYSMESYLSTVKAREPYFQKIIAELKQWTQTVDRNPLKTDIPPVNLDLSRLQLPRPRCTLKIHQPFGGAGGTPFQDVNLSHVMHGVYILDLRIYYGAIIDCVSTVYGFNDKGLKTMPRKNGGNAPTSSSHQFDPRRRITGLNLTKAFYNQTTLFHGMDIYIGAQREFMQLGSVSAELVSVGPTPNQYLVGWSGRAGVFVDALAPIYAQFEDPEWVDFRSG